MIRKLNRGYPETWEKVLIGETGILVTIPEYLFKETLVTTEKMLHELCAKQTLGLYQRNPDRWKEQVRRTAVQLIKRIREEEK